MQCLTDDDFLSSIVDDDEFLSYPDIKASIPDLTTVLGMPRCSCGRVVGEVTADVTTILGSMIREEQRVTGGVVSQEQYESFLSAAINQVLTAKEQSLAPCCLTLIESMPRVPLPAKTYSDRKISDSDRLLSLPDTRREGNMIVTIFEPSHYNPYTYTDERVIDTQTTEEEELERLKTNLGIKPALVVSNYPILPATDDTFELEEDPKLYGSVETDYVIRGRGYTGVSGFDVTVIRKSSILAR